MAEFPLSGYRVVDLSTGLPGAYCGKLLVDAGAELIKVETPEGDPLRRWTATGATIAHGDDGALFKFLACSKHSVAADPEDAVDVDLTCRLLAAPDAVLWSRGSRLTERAEFSPKRLRSLSTEATVVAITPFGLDGLWSDRPATEFTLQAWSGAIGLRGWRDQPPVSVGGRHGEWMAGIAAAVGLDAPVTTAHRPSTENNSLDRISILRSCSGGV
jgi:crotonobetainyl-CoA:carnitine CoA-transferase CaiB-like acyl-CoA transferase